MSRHFPSACEILIKLLALEIMEMGRNTDMGCMRVTGGGAATPYSTLCLINFLPFPLY